MESDRTFWKGFILSAIFFTIAPITLGVSLYSLFSINLSQAKPEVLAYETTSDDSIEKGVRVYASLPSSFPSFSGYAESSDARTEIIKNYLKENRSPLEPYAYQIVESADRYDLDYRLITAIAQKESNLCKVIPPSSYNCWGWGIHSKGTLGFSSFEEGIETVSKGIKLNYIDKGYATVEEIMSKYTPLSKGSWAEGVNRFMDEMQ
ncbi:hypothetical protein ACFL1Q_00050 [Patescibacteria group bacterium]